MIIRVSCDFVVIRARSSSAGTSVDIEDYVKSSRGGGQAKQKTSLNPQKKNLNLYWQERLQQEQREKAGAICTASLSSLSKTALESKSEFKRQCPITFTPLSPCDLIGSAFT